MCLGHIPIAKTTFVPKKEAEISTMFPRMQADGVFIKIKECLSVIEDNADSILLGANDNTVEHFNSKISQKIGGKRVNFCLRGSYQARYSSAVVSHNNSFPMIAFHMIITQLSPGKYTKQRGKEEEPTKFKKPKIVRKVLKKKLTFCQSDSKAYGVLSQTRLTA